MFAVVDDFEAGDLGLPGADAGGDGAQVFCPLGTRCLWPAVCVEGAAGGFDGRIDILGRRSGDVVDHRLRRRVDHLEGSAVGRGFPLAVDIEFATHEKSFQKRSAR
jgi:hypothetical protein